ARHKMTRRRLRRRKTASSRDGRRDSAPAPVSGLWIFGEDKTGVGATKAKTVRHDKIERIIVFRGLDDRKICRFLIDALNVSRWRNEPLLVHDQAVNRLMRARAAQRMSCQRFG